MVPHSGLSALGRCLPLRLALDSPLFLGISVIVHGNSPLLRPTPSADVMPALAAFVALR
jgi:hypothetical protein